MFSLQVDLFMYCWQNCHYRTVLTQYRVHDSYFTSNFETTSFYMYTHVHTFAWVGCTRTDRSTITISLQFCTYSLVVVRAPFAPSLQKFSIEFMRWFCVLHIHAHLPQGQVSWSLVLNLHVHMIKHIVFLLRFFYAPLGAQLQFRQV